jgi:homocysteine S-methyltransferase
MIERLLASRPFVVLDGGLSTALQELGEQPAGALWTAAALIDRPEVIVAAHRRFVEAGAEVIITSSYQASEAGLGQAGCTAVEARRLLASTTDVARRAGAAVVAASVGPYGACRADGSEYHGLYDVPWDDVRRFHARRLDVLVDTGADVYAVETMPSAVEAEIVVAELRRRTDAPSWVSFTCADDRHTCSGDVFADAAAAVAPAVSWVGVNCTAPAHVAGLLSGVVGPSVAYPNHGGTWDPVAKCWSAGGPVFEPHRVAEWVHAGARLVGGCCGVGSADIAALAELRAQWPA